MFSGSSQSTAGLRWARGCPEGCGPETSRRPDALHGALQRSIRACRIPTCRSPRADVSRPPGGGFPIAETAGPWAVRSRTREPPGGSRPCAAVPPPVPAAHPEPAAALLSEAQDAQSEFGASVHFRGKAEHASDRPALRTQTALGKITHRAMVLLIFMLEMYVVVSAISDTGTLS